MYAAGYSIEEIYEGYSDAVVKAAAALKTVEGLTSEEIVAGYVNYWMNCETPAGLTDMKVMMTDRGLELVVTGENPEFKDSNLVNVAVAAGLIEQISSPVTITWKNLETGFENSATDLVSFKTTNWPNLLSGAKKGNSYEITVSIGENVLTLWLSKAAE